MNKAYILVFSNQFGVREDVQRYLDQWSEILNWRSDFPNAIFLISEMDADDIASLLREFSHDKGRFFVVEIGSNKQGWLPKGAWEFLRKKPGPPNDPFGGKVR